MNTIPLNLQISILPASPDGGGASSRLAASAPAPGPTGQPPPQPQPQGATLPWQAPDHNTVDYFADDEEMARLVATIGRYRRNSRPIPVAVRDPRSPIRLGPVAPAKYFEVAYDPLRAMMNDPQVQEYLITPATESSGSASGSLAAAAGTQYYARGLAIAVARKPDSTGAVNALLTFTYNPEHLNADRVADVEDAGGVTTGGDVLNTTPAPASVRFNCQANTEGIFYYHFAMRPATNPICTPVRASVATPIASGDHGTHTVAYATTGLTSGSLFTVTPSILAPTAPEWFRYADHMLRYYYELGA